MSINRYTPTIPASGVIETQTGNFFLLLSASGSVSLRLENGGHAEQFNGVNGGLLVRRIKPWENARILGAAGITLEYLQGSDFVEKDETDVRLQIATIAGVAATRLQPFSSVTDLAPVSLTQSQNAELFPANPLRQRITVCVDPNNPDIATCRMHGPGANTIRYLQPGVEYTFSGFYGAWVFTPATVGTYNFALFEEG